MPTYDYQCDHCGHAFAAVQPFGEAALTVCPSCGKSPRRLIYASAIVFKGSGWYKTDSRPAAKADSPPTDKADGAAAPGGDAVAASAEKPAQAPAKASEKGAAEAGTSAPRKTSGRPAAGGKSGSGSSP